MRLLDAGGEGAGGGVERADSAALTTDSETSSSDRQADLLGQRNEGKTRGSERGRGGGGGEDKRTGSQRTMGDFSLSAATPLPALKLARASGAAKPSGTTFFLRCCSSSTPISLILVLISILMPGKEEPLSTSMLEEEPTAADDRKRDSAPCTSASASSRSFVTRAMTRQAASYLKAKEDESRAGNFEEWIKRVRRRTGRGHG